MLFVSSIGFPFLILQFCFSTDKGDGKNAAKKVGKNTGAIDGTALDENPKVAVVDNKKKAKKTRRKEQSVLQAKLTKLAIQIGYAGKCVPFSHCSLTIVLHCTCPGDTSLVLPTKWISVSVNNKLSYLSSCFV